jgi:hypothetical protein
MVSISPTFFEQLRAKLSYKKAVREMLVKLTNGSCKHHVSFTPALWYILGANVC